MIQLKTWPVTLRRPFADYGAAWAGTGFACLLDSAVAGRPLGEWSFIAGPPVQTLSIEREGRLAVVRMGSNAPAGNDAVGRVAPKAAWNLLRQFVAPIEIAADGDAPPFVGGAVGYLGYEAMHFVEDLPTGEQVAANLPVARWWRVDSVLAHHHPTGKTVLAAIEPNADKCDALRAAWMDRLRSVEDAGNVRKAPQPHRAYAADAKTSLTHDAYIANVQAIQGRIAAGDVYEANLTYQLEAPAPRDPWATYLELRERNPAPFGAYLQTPEADVLCCSPERFLRLMSDGAVETRPIKGTRPRGATPADDEQLRRALADSEKDRAEHVMIVDLLRNDIGRVCAYGSIDVANAMAIESYATVHQMVSTVRGRLRPDCDAIDLLRACFPGGSMTGAPKIAAMKIIQELEPLERGVYSGCIGYFDCRGGMDLNIVIRTAVVFDGQTRIGTGGAIVADSDPEAEWEETIVKSRALRDVLSPNK